MFCHVLFGTCFAFCVRRWGGGTQQTDAPSPPFFVSPAHLGGARCGATAQRPTGSRPGPADFADWALLTDPELKGAVVGPSAAKKGQFGLARRRRDFFWAARSRGKFLATTVGISLFCTGKKKANAFFFL